jgi:hypothetical protein
MVALAATLGTVTVAEACPDWQLQPSFGQINLNAGFLPDPFLRSVTAGGGFNLGQCGFAYPGWVAARPDFDLYYQAGSNRLTITIQSATDTILLINDPNGRWLFNDDAPGMGTGASITIQNPPTGLYDIWIGTYNRASGIPATLVITER